MQTMAKIIGGQLNRIPVNNNFAFVYSVGIATYCGSEITGFVNVIGYTVET